MQAPTKTPEELCELLAFTDTRSRPAMWRAMLLLSFRLGLRPKEIAQLHTNQFASGSLRIQRGHSKGKSSRTLPVCAEVMSALYEHLQGREGWVFLNRDGSPFDAAGISSAMRRLYREAGTRGSCYSGRRTAGQALQDANVNVFTIQAFFGHTSPQTTLNYLGVSPNQLRNAMSVLNG